MPFVSRLGILLPCCLIIGLAQESAAQGIMVPATGPVNRSMGGAATAAPLEAIGALYWNPASISGLPSSEIGFGMGLALPILETDSSIPGLASGSTNAEPGVTPLPNVGWVHQPENSSITYGLGLFAAAGFRSNFPASLTNPVFAPQSNVPGVPGGLGRVFTEASFLEIVPTISVEVADGLSIGVGPTVTLGEVIVDPLVTMAPNDADGSGVPTYPSGRGTRTHWGGGAQMGIYYERADGIQLGLSCKSPQWMEEFRLRTEDELGRPVVGHVNLDLPLIVSLGAAYSGWENWVLATDLRYFDYENTDGFRKSGFDADGSLAGLGWESIFSLATGVQYELNEDLFLRSGYTYNQNPIPEDLAFFNIGSPLYYQHELHVGSSYRLFPQVWLQFAYSYFFENEISGSIVTPGGAIPGSQVTNRESVHVADFGITVRY